MTPPLPGERISVEQLDRYLRGGATPQEHDAIRAWLDAFPEGRSFVEQMMRPPVESDLDTAWAAVAKQVAQKNSRVIAAKEFARWSTRLFGAAMVFVLVLAGGYLLRFNSSPRIGVTHAYVTNSNQQGILPLSDGSRVLLSPGTTLRTVEFRDRSRTVILDRGEAYFDVAPSAGIPFTVTSGSVTTQVLGTAFYIRRYDDERRVRVSVVDGKVHVVSRVHPSANVILTAGHIGEVSDSTAQIATVDDLSPRVEWQHDQMVFHDTPVRAVLQALERWYGYRFVCADSALPLRNVTIVLSTASSASALAKLEQILTVNLTVAGDTITLTPHQHSAKQALEERHYDVWTFPREVGR